MYMLVGLYTGMAIFSPWVQSINRNEQRAYLIIWVFLTTFPFIRRGSYELFETTSLWGEETWNEFSSFYYISGFIGYVILGYYLKMYYPAIEITTTLIISIPLYIVGFAITFLWFYFIAPTDEFPAQGDSAVVTEMETSWRFCSTGVLAMTVALFLLFRHAEWDGWFHTHIMMPVSKVTFGAYLMHIFWLNFYFHYTNDWLDGVNEWWGTPVTIILTAILTFASSIITTKIISFIPYSKYIVG